MQLLDFAKTHNNTQQHPTAHNNTQQTPNNTQQKNKSCHYMVLKKNFL